MTFEEVLQMVMYSANRHFYSGGKDIKTEVLKCTTQIYIAQMQTNVDLCDLERGEEE